MIPRDRVLELSGIKQPSSKQYDQKSIRSFLVPGSNYRLSKDYHKVKNHKNYRRPDHKLNALKNGVPVIFPIVSMNDRPMLNLFDPSMFQLEYAMKQNQKNPIDYMGYNQNLSHNRDKAIKMADKAYVLRAETYENDKINRFKDNIQLQNSPYFLEDRKPHDIREHRKNVSKNGHIEPNPFESTHKLLNILKDISNQQNNKLATSHRGTGIPNI